MDKLVFASLFDRNEIIADCLEKGRKATIGEIREWKGQRYQKQGNGQWVPVKGQSSNQPKQEKQDGKIDIKELTNLAKKETKSGFDLKEKNGEIIITTYPDGEDYESSVDTKGKSKEDIAKEIAKKVENAYANYNYNMDYMLAKSKRNLGNIDKTNTMGNIFTSIYKGLNIDSFNQSKEDFLEKGKRATVGEIRDWKGVKFQKQPNGGWIPVKGQGIVKDAKQMQLDELYSRFEKNVLAYDDKKNLYDWKYQFENDIRDTEVALARDKKGSETERVDKLTLAHLKRMVDAIDKKLDSLNEIPAWMQEMGVKSLEEYREKAESARKEKQPSRDAELKRLKDDVFTHVGEKDLLYAKEGIEKQIRESTYYKNFYAERATGKYPHDTFDYGSAEADKVVYEEKVKDEEVYLDLLNKELEEVNNALSKISTFEKVQKGDTIQISGTKFEVIGRNADNSIKMKADNGIEISIDKANFEKLGIKSRDEIAKQDSIKTPNVNRQTGVGEVADWYKQNFPTDDMGNNIPEATFGEMYNKIKEGTFSDEGWDADDSVVRERIFEKLAEIKGVPYDTIYDLWINSIKKEGISQDKAKVDSILQDLYFSIDYDNPQYVERIKSIHNGTSEELKNLDEGEKKKLLDYATKEMEFIEEYKAKEAQEPKIVRGETVKSPFPDYDPWRD